MQKQDFLKLLDECVDQEKLLKGVGASALKPELEKIKTKVLSHEIDLLPKSEIDQILLVKVIDSLIEKI